MWQWEWGGKHNKMHENSCKPQERSTTTSVPHHSRNNLSATGLEMRTEREKQHLPASYSLPTTSSGISPSIATLVMLKSPQYLPPHWKTWFSALTWPFQILKIEEYTASVSPQYTSVAYFQHNQRTAGRVHWPQTAYFYVSTVNLIEEWLKEFWQFKVGDLLIYTRNSHPSWSISTFCSYLQSGTNQFSYHFFWFTQFTFIILLAGQNFCFPLLWEKCFNLLQPVPHLSFFS